MIYYILYISLTIYCIFILFIYLLKNKIEVLEKEIIQLFKEKNNQIPSIFEITKGNVNKHKEIFNEILSLKKKDFLENSIYSKISEKSNTYKKIHNEFNFIFRICNKNPKLNKIWNFLLLKDIIILKSYNIWQKIELYKKIIIKFNRLILIKNISIIWLIIPISKKINI